MEYREFRAMSTNIQLAAEGPADAVAAGFDQAQAFIQASEKRFTRFSPESELSGLNRSGEAGFAASPELFDVVAQALELHRQTQGLFDPAILDALESAGYDRSIDEIRRNGGSTEVHPGEPKRRRFIDIRLDALQLKIYLPSGLRLDLGGIAKGWIAERAAVILSSWVSACAVNAGGDMFLVGLPPGETSWLVTLEDPTDAERSIAVLKVGPGAVATSSVTKRRWEQGGKDQHHLIDPRTQLPADAGLLSATVIASHVTEAEVYAKSLLIGGLSEADRLERLDLDLEFILIDKNKKLWGSKHSREIINV